MKSTKNLRIVINPVRWKKTAIQGELESGSREIAIIRSHYQGTFSGDLTESEH
jgi:hypothetical protein